MNDGDGKSRASQRRAQVAPNPARLHEAALAYLARFASTEANLARVLTRRVDRWARYAEAEADPDTIAAIVCDARKAIASIVRRLAAAGAVDDAAFATARAARLSRAGKSRRAIRVHLAARGVAAETAAAALPNGRDEIAAALLLARRRKIGPFRPKAETDPAERRRELGIFGRAGFPAEIAAAVMAMTREAAEQAIRDNQ